MEGLTYTNACGANGNPFSLAPPLYSAARISRAAVRGIVPYNKENTMTIMVLVGIALVFFLAVLVNGAIGFAGENKMLKAPPPADGDDPRSQPVSRKEFLEERRRTHALQAATGLAGALLAALGLKQLWDKRNEEAS